jgi:exosome complex RNA-binding protein Rrp42 (RNase PH superfamily)
VWVRRLGVGFVSTAQASALVKSGKTSVLAGIKLEVMTPSANAPNQGVIQVRVSLSVKRPLQPAGQRSRRRAEQPENWRRVGGD